MMQIDDQVVVIELVCVYPCQVESRRTIVYCHQGLGDAELQSVKERKLIRIASATDELPRLLCR